MNIKIMTNAIKLTLCLSLLVAISGVSAAHAGYGYLGIAFGQALSDTDKDTINRQLAIKNPDLKVTSLEEQRFASHFYAGLRINPINRIELGYLDLGDVSLGIRGSAADLEAAIATFNRYHPSAKGFTAHYLWRFLQLDRINFQAKLGVFNWKSEYQLNLGSINQKINKSGSDIAYGLIIDAEIIQHWEVRLAADRYKVDNENVTFFSLGVGYWF